LLLRQDERDRLKVLHEVKQGHLTQRAAAEQLGISERWVRELVRRVRKKGDRAVVHGLRGRPSKRRISGQTQARAVDLYRKEYGDFGPTLAAEYGIEVSKETLRKWLMKEGEWTAKPRRVKAGHVWRPRRSCRGELLQWDTSIHDWLEGRSREPVKLVGMIDDASNDLWARFVGGDTTSEHMKVFGKYVRQHGRPLACYVDRATLFQVNPKRKGYGEEMTEAGESQIGRALRELGIELIHANSPQAKGRVERCFGTLQDRREPASAVDAHRPLGAGHDLDGILSHVEKRRVTNNYTVSWDGKTYQIPREAVGPGLRSSSIQVEGRLDGKVWARIGARAIQLTRCTQPLPELKVQAAAEERKDHNRGGRSGWMSGFELKKAMPGWRAQQIAERTG
jgi:transposase